MLGESNDITELNKFIEFLIKEGSEEQDVVDGMVIIGSDLVLRAGVTLSVLRDDLMEAAKMVMVLHGLYKSAEEDATLSAGRISAALKVPPTGLSHYAMRAILRGERDNNENTNS